MKTRILIALLAASILGIGFYIASQKPKLSLDPQQFGLMLLKGRYRSWLLSFSDGKMFDANSKKWVSVVIRYNSRVGIVYTNDTPEVRNGYRIIPRFSHVDMRDFEALNK